MRDDHWLHFASRRRRNRAPFLWLLSLLLLIYATLGRSGAYIGIPLAGGNGIFIGELVLSFGLAASLLEGSWQRFFTLPVALPWFFFVTWNAARTLPYISEYGLTTLRDGVAWGYSLFAVIVSSQLLARPPGFGMLLNKYARFARLYPFFVLIMTPVAIDLDVQYSGPRASANPSIGPTGVSAMLVHVTGAMGVVVGGLVSVRAAWWWMLTIEFLVISCIQRGALMSFLAAAAVLRLLNPGDMRLSVRSIRVIPVIGAVLAVMLMFDFNFGVYHGGRAIAPRQLLVNFMGSFEGAGESVDGTREWREAWWSKIIDYTVYGPYFWTGKGYGINLADDDGFQVLDKDDPAPLRSPHNSHLTFLARSGVPGFSLWLALQLTWVISVLRALFLARRTGRHRTTGLLAFLLAYWTAFMTLAATDVLIEGPAGGIWFWTIFGVGAAAARMVRRDADFFERIELRAALAASGRSRGLRRTVPATRS